MIYSTDPARLERARCFLARAFFSTLLNSMVLASRLLHRAHPVRIYIEGRVPEIRSLIILGSIPTGRPRSPRATRADRTWFLLVALVAACVIGDLSHAIALDPFGLPDINLHAHELLGLDVDNRTGPHLFNQPLPWRDGSLMTFGLLTASLATAYAWRPGGRRRRLIAD